MQKYSVNQQLIETILAWVNAGEIAIPEIQRPFVWDSSKVRDLIDSLYQGYPIGYLIAWKNPNVRLKDGSANSSYVLHSHPCWMYQLTVSSIPRFRS
jgi:uncharacterized protein with ParB-like and HNH nuclease domain